MFVSIHTTINRLDVHKSVHTACMRFIRVSSDNFPDQRVSFETIGERSVRLRTIERFFFKLCLASSITWWVGLLVCFKLTSSLNIWMTSRFSKWLWQPTCGTPIIFAIFRLVEVARREAFDVGRVMNVDYHFIS